MFRRRISPRSSTSSWLLLMLALAVIAFPACQKKEKPAAAPPATTPPPANATVPAVTGVELGKAIQANKRVVMAQNTFAPADTIYAVVMTEGIADSATLIARWTYEDGQLVDESTQSIMMSGPANTEFHIMKPNGWPAGKYQVQISLNGTPAKSAEFMVK
ncbi:MAG TPA: hypothetical protein VNM87_09055 [Candidatus Udaeobacter sp.]|nr:hypothetical protein [Candidatus Udaeobacter sp.]